MLSVCPDIKPPPAQIHAMTSGHDDASDSSDNESVIVLTQIDEAILAHPQPVHFVVPSILICCYLIANQPSISSLTLST